MPWAKVDDNFFQHDKLLEVGMAARGLWITALSRSCRNGNPVITVAGATFLAMGEDPTSMADQLVAAGMWHPAGHDCDRCPQVDAGWVIHDWSEYQEKSTSEKRAEAGAKGGKAGTGTSKQRTKPQPVQVKPDDTDGEQEHSNPQAPAQATGKHEDKQPASKRASRSPEPEPDTPADAGDAAGVHNDHGDTGDPMPLEPADEATTYSRTLAEWAVRNGHSPPDATARRSATAAWLIDVLQRHLPKASKQELATARGKARAVIVDYLVDVTGQEMPQPGWGLLGRHIAENGAGPTLESIRVAVEAGAGLQPPHSDDPLSLFHYATGVRNGTGRKAAS